MIPYSGITTNIGFCISSILYFGDHRLIDRRIADCCGTALFDIAKTQLHRGNATDDGETACTSMKKARHSANGASHATGKKAESKAFFMVVIRADRDGNHVPADAGVEALGDDVGQPIIDDDFDLDVQIRVQLASLCRSRLAARLACLHCLRPRTDLGTIDLRPP